MNVFRYPSPEWLDASEQQYRALDRFQKALEKITTKIFFNIKADPVWGLEKDLYFGAITEHGFLLELRFFSAAEAKATADFILSAPPAEWKKILRKEEKFLTDFMLGKISLEQGSKVGILGLAPYAGIFIDAITQFSLIFPDEMDEKAGSDFRSYIKDFRNRLCV